MVLLLPKKFVIIIYTSILTHQTDIRKQTKAIFYIYIKMHQITRKTSKCHPTVMYIKKKRLGEVIPRLNSHYHQLNIYKRLFFFFYNISYLIYIIMEHIYYHTINYHCYFFLMQK